MSKSVRGVPDDEGAMVLIFAIPIPDKTLISTDVPNRGSNLVIAPERLTEWLLGNLPFFLECRKRSSVGHAELINALIRVTNQCDLTASLPEKVQKNQQPHVAVLRFINHDFRKASRDPFSNV